MGKYLETQGNREIEILNDQIKKVKNDGKSKLLNDGIDNKSLGLARYIAALQVEEILNQYGEDMERNTRSSLVSDSTMSRLASSIKNSPAFKDVIKNMSENDLENFYDNEEKIKDVYTQYGQSTLQKADEPKYTLMTAERKAQVAANNQAAEAKKAEMSKEYKKKLAAEEKKAAKEKAAAEKKAAKEEKKRLKEETKRKKAEEKKRKADEKKRLKEEAKRKKAEEKAAKAEKKRKDAEDKKRLKEASKQKKEPVKVETKAEPKTEAVAFDAVRAIEGEYKMRQNEVVYATDPQLAGEKTKIAFAVQTEKTKNELLANSAQYKSQNDVFKKFSTGAVLSSSKKLLSDEKFNLFFNSLSDDQKSNVLDGTTSTQEICAQYESFVPQKVQAEPEKTPTSVSPEVEHYTKSIEDGIASQRKRIMDTYNDKSIDPNTKKNTYEKSFANIMTYKAMEQKLEKDGANMTKDQMRDLCNNTNAKRSRDKLMQDKTFTEICKMMKEDDYRVIGEDRVKENLPQYKAMFNNAQKKANEVVPPQKEKQAAGRVL